MKSRRLHAIRRHIGRLERRRQWLEMISQRYSRARATIVLVGMVAIFLGSRAFGESLAWSLAGVVATAFGVVASYHGRVKDSLRRHTIWLHIKTTHAARMTLDWAHIPPPLALPPDTAHPFANDLNLIGARSVHQLLDTAISRQGSARLRTWLLHPVTAPEQVRARQALVRELMPRVMFRDRLTLHGTLVAQDPYARWDGEALRHWLEGPSVPAAFMPWLLVLGGLAAANITLGILYAMSLLPAFWVSTFAVYIVLYYFQHSRLSSLFVEAFRLEKTLHQFRAVLLYLETYSYSRAPHLARLCVPLRNTVIRPSALLKKIARIAGAASVQQGNVIGPLVNALVPWDLYFAYRFNQCKAAARAHLPVWLETWYELEALNALANFGYMNPDGVFPNIVAPAEGTKSPVFLARDMQHPLLPDDTRVGNDFTLERLGEVVIITGSNMSGKSTFLRTVGVNLCLAFNGAPVPASTWHTMPFRLFTCITVSDSVTDGMSYFYAEVRRLKALLDALQEAHPYPLFFLIDEIFRGTNNRERHIGSRAYIQALAGGYGVGIVSTHDLDLVKLDHEIEGIHNAHFREDVAGGQMVFDYKLRPGPCPTTNALQIMRLAGLPLP
jgi:MutS domain V